MVPAVEFARHTPLLVPPDVSQAKLDEELEQWHANVDVYRRRGWLLLSAKDLRVEIAFVGVVSLIDKQLPVITAAIRLTYNNYDLWPPSLAFIDARTGAPSYPIVHALDRADAGDVRNVLLEHPDGGPFLCIPGLREYHSHPQHSGDDWLLHRSSGAGRLAVVCERVWRRMVRNVVGLTVQVTSLPLGHGVQVVMALAQGDVDSVTVPAVPTAVSP